MENLAYELMSKCDEVRREYNKTGVCVICSKEITDYDVISKNKKGIGHITCLIKEMGSII